MLMMDETTELQHTPVSEEHVLQQGEGVPSLPIRLPLLYFHSELNLIEMVSTFCSRHIEDGPSIDKVSWKKNLRAPQHVSTHSHSQDKQSAGTRLGFVLGMDFRHILKIQCMYAHSVSGEELRGRLC